MKPRRFLLDTNVLVSAVLRAQGPPALCLRLGLSSAFTLVVSAPLLDEYEEVLKRPRFKLDPTAIDELLELVRAAAVSVKPTPLPQDVVSDPDDQMVLETAVAGKALFLVTGNRKDFPESYRGTQVLAPTQFLGQAAEKRPRTPGEWQVKTTRGKKKR